jgi:hypothetical protein
MLDDKLQDTWLLTSDAGLAALCASFYFVPMDGERAKFTSVASSRTREITGYWRYVDRACSRLLAERAQARRGEQDFVDEAFITRVSNLALELNDRLTRVSKPD